MEQYIQQNTDKLFEQWSNYYQLLQWIENDKQVINAFTYSKDGIAESLSFINKLEKIFSASYNLYVPTDVTTQLESVFKDDDNKFEILDKTQYAFSYDSEGRISKIIRNIFLEDQDRAEDPYYQFLVEVSYNSKHKINTFKFNFHHDKDFIEIIPVYDQSQLLTGISFSYVKVAEKQRINRHIDLTSSEALLNSLSSYIGDEEVNIYQDPQLLLEEVKNSLWPTPLSELTSVGDRSATYRFPITNNGFFYVGELGRLAKIFPETNPSEFDDLLARILTGNWDDIYNPESDSFQFPYPPFIVGKQVKFPIEDINVIINLEIHLPHNYRPAYQPKQSDAGELMFDTQDTWTMSEDRIEVVGPVQMNHFYKNQIPEISITVASSDINKLSDEEKKEVLEMVISNIAKALDINSLS